MPNGHRWKQNLVKATKRGFVVFDCLCGARLTEPEGGHDDEAY